MKRLLRKRSFIASGFFATVLLVLGCTAGNSGLSLATFVSDYGPPQVVGRIQTDDIKESSGLSASECQDVLWTHNDAGNDAFIFAMGLDGRHLGTWRVKDAASVDWESIATQKDSSGRCHLLIGDIGDNDENRANAAIYRIPEPSVSAETASATTKSPLETAPAEVMRFTYVDGPKNAEVLLVQPQTGNIVILTKMKNGPSQVHRLKPAFGSTEMSRTEKIADVVVPSEPAGLLTGGSYSPDGTRVMLCDKKGGYELVLPSGQQPDAIWTQKPVAVDLGDRKQGEGVSYGRDGLSLYASSEKKNTPIIRIERKRS